MITDLNKVLVGSNTLNVFWHSHTNEIPKLVKMAVRSWQLHNHHVNVWTLGKEYDFGTPVDTIDFESIVGKDNIPYEMMNYQKAPLGKDGRTMLGFVDWARYKMMTLKHNMKIMDTDVILLKHWNTRMDMPTIVCEESFHAGNKLFGLYPVAGIIHDVNSSFGSFLEPKAREKAHDGMEHGHVMKQIHEFCSMFHKLDFRYFKEKGETNKDLSRAIDIVGHNAFFELGYDELDVFYNELKPSVTRRLKDVVGIHCWNSILDEEKAFQEGTILDILYKLIMKHGVRPEYDLLKIKGTVI